MVDDPSEDPSPRKPRLSAERTRLRRRCGQNIHRLMQAKGWSQSDLARAAGLGRDRISKYVRGVYLPQTTHLELIARALDVQPSDLIGADAPPERGGIRLRIRGDQAVLDILDLHVRYPEALPIVESLRRHLEVARLAAAADSDREAP